MAGIALAPYREIAAAWRWTQHRKLCPGCYSGARLCPLGLALLSFRSSPWAKK